MMRRSEESVFEVKLTRYTLTLFVATLFIGALFFGIVVVGEIAQRNREIERHRSHINDLQNEVIDKMKIIEEKNLEIREKEKQVEELKEYKNILDAVKDLSMNKVTEKQSKELARAIYETSKKYKYNWRLPTAVIMTESSFRPNVESTDPSYGLMQIKLGTAIEVAPKIGLEINNKKELMNITNNVNIGSTYLFNQILEFKDVKKAIIAYNLGPTKTRRIEKIRGDFETEYLRKIMKNYEYLKKKYKV